MNKTLLQILVDELPLQGGWPKHARAIVQDTYKTISVIDFAANEWSVFSISETFDLASDFTTAIVTKEQYEAALNQAR